MINSLPDYSNIHFIIQNNPDEKIRRVSKIISKKAIFIYPTFNSVIGPMGYVQDFGEATGSRNSAGQFEIINHPSYFLTKDTHRLLWKFLTIHI